MITRFKIKDISAINVAIIEVKEAKICNTEC